MKKIKIESPQDLFEIVKRRKWVLLVPFLLIAIITGLVAYALPDIFRSETMIIVENQRVPEKVVPKMGETDTMDRLRTLRQQVFSRTYLASIVKEFNLYSDFRLRLSDDDKIMALHRAINIDDAVDRGSRIAYFRLSYENKDAYIAQKVTSRLAALFIEYDNRQRLYDVNSTREFLEAEVKKIEKALQEYQSQISHVRSKHADSLPENLMQNLETLKQLRDQHSKAVDALDRSEDKLLGLKKEMASVPPHLDKVRTMVKPGKKIDEDDPDYLNERLETLNEELAAWSKRYTPNHPEVASRLKEKEKIEAQLKRAGGDKAAGAGKSESQKSSRVTVEQNPRYVELRQQVEEAESEIKQRQKQIDRLSREIALYAQWVEKTPKVTAEIKGIDQAFQGLDEKYKEMTKSLDAARLAVSLAQKQKGEQFRIQDPASLPMSPAKPPRPIILAVGTLIGLGLGILLALLAEYLDQKIRTKSEVEGSLGLPVLVEIPEILNHRELTIKRMKRTLAFSFSMALFAGVVVALVQIFFKNYQVIIEHIILSGFI